MLIPFLIDYFVIHVLVGIPAIAAAGTSAVLCVAMAIRSVTLDKYLPVLYQAGAALADKVFHKKAD